MQKIFKYCAILFVLLVFCFDESFCEENSCADWTSFKDEKCFWVIDNTLRTYDEAEKACAQLENSPTLAIIHSQEEQDFLVNYLFKSLKKVDNFWIGAKSSSSSTFKWVDNTEMNFSNWVKVPKNISNYCVQMQSEVDMVGKWIDEPCEKRNAAVCQKMQTWSIARLQKLHLERIKELKEALDETNNKINQQKHEFEEANKTNRLELDEANKKISDQKHEFENLKQNIIPIGFLYTQLPFEKSPTIIWPSMTWSDVSSAYHGVFFRVEGGGSEPFEHTQTENDRSLVRLEKSIDEGKSVFKNYTFYADAVGQNTKTTDWIYMGDDAKDKNHDDYFRLTTSIGEIRPRNMAIRVWKRTG